MNSGNIEDMLKLFSIQFRYVLAGIIAWGIGCGKDGLPGVYASVRNALCFIDWDTKCKHGSDFIGHYDYRNDCTGWIDELIAQLKTNRIYRSVLKKAEALKNSCGPSNS